MTWQRPFVNSQDLAGTFSVPAHFTSGHAIGVIAVDLKYPKLPGNVVNATTFDFPVLYKKVEFDIEPVSYTHLDVYKRQRYICSCSD